MTFHDFLAANYFGSNLSGFFLSFYGGRTAGNDGPAGRGGAETAVGTRRWGPGGGDPAVGTRRWGPAHEPVTVEPVTVGAPAETRVAAGSLSLLTQFVLITILFSFFFSLSLSLFLFRLSFFFLSFFFLILFESNIVVAYVITHTRTEQLFQLSTVN